MQAHDNPVFVEDMARNVAPHYHGDERITWFSVEAANDESIHNHAAFARIPRQAAQPPSCHSGLVMTRVPERQGAAQRTLHIVVTCTNRKKRRVPITPPAGHPGGESASRCGRGSAA